MALNPYGLGTRSSKLVLKSESLEYRLPLKESELKDLFGEPLSLKSFRRSMIH